jgi:Na+/proline symporter
MLAAMFSSTMASLSAIFNIKSAILTKDIYQTLFRKNAGERELLAVGWVTTFLVGGLTITIAAVMASTRQSVFAVMLTFNTLLSLAYGPPALLGLVIRRTPPWSGLATFTTGLLLGALGAFVYDWTLIQQVAIVIPASFGVFFLSMLFDRADWPERARLFQDLDTPVDIERELKDVPDYTVQVFRFLSWTVGLIGALSLLLLFSTSGRDRATVICFASITLVVGFLLRLIHGRESQKSRIVIASAESAG